MSIKTIKKKKILRASDAIIWSSCPDSVRFQSEYISDDNEYSKEGTAQHNLAEDYLKKNLLLLLKEEKEFCEEELSGFSPNIASYIKTVYTTLKKEEEYEKKISVLNGKLTKPSKWQVFIEERVSFDSFVPNGLGTPDLVVVRDNCAYIFDYKNGWEYVSVENNYQINLYALGVHQKFKGSIDFFRLMIFQPKRKNQGHLIITKDQLLTFGKFIGERAKIALSKDAVKIAGEKQCHWCDGRHDCSTLANTKIKPYYDLLNKEDITEDEFFMLIRDWDFISRHHKSIYEKVESRLKDGDEFDGYFLPKQKYTRAWIDEAKEVLINILGIDVACPKKPKTIIQLMDQESLSEKAMSLIEPVTAKIEVKIDRECPLMNETLPLDSEDYTVSEKTSDDEKRFFLDNFDKLKVLRNKKEKELLKLLSTENIEGFFLHEKTKYCVKFGKEEEFYSLLGEDDFTRGIIGITAVEKLDNFNKDEIEELTYQKPNKRAMKRK